MCLWSNAREQLYCWVSAVLCISTGNAHLFSSALMHRPRSSCLIVWRCLEAISGNELKGTERPSSFLFFFFFFPCLDTHSETWIILIHSLKLTFCSANKCLLLVFCRAAVEHKSSLWCTCCISAAGRIYSCQDLFCGCTFILQLERKTRFHKQSLRW